MFRILTQLYVPTPLLGRLTARSEPALDVSEFEDTPRCTTANNVTMLPCHVERKCCSVRAMALLWCRLVGWLRSKTNTALYLYRETVEGC